MACKITDTAKLEICCFHLASVGISQDHRVEQIELCVDYPSGGLFPGKDLIQNARNMFDGTMFVMIRPKPGGFVYNRDDYRIMKEQITMAIGEGADGLTIGASSRSNEIPDQELASLLSCISADILLTFHRAFDQLKEPIRQLETIRSLGFDRILTSGGPGDARENIQKLREYQNHSPKGLHVVAAGGIRAEHIPKLKDAGITYFHAAAGGYEKDVLDPAVLQALQESINDHAQ